MAGAGAGLVAGGGACIYGSVGLVAWYWGLGCGMENEGEEEEDGFEGGGDQGWVVMMLMLYQVRSGTMM